MNWTDNMPYVTIPRQYTYLYCWLPTQTSWNPCKSHITAHRYHWPADPSPFFLLYCEPTRILLRIVLPFYSHSTVDCTPILLAFYWWLHSHSTSLLLMILLPFSSHSTDDSTPILLALYWWFCSHSARIILMIPLPFYSHSTDDSTPILLAFYWWFYSHSAHILLMILFPFYLQSTYDSTPILLKFSQWWNDQQNLHHHWLFFFEALVLVVTCFVNSWPCWIFLPPTSVRNDQ